MADNAVLEPGRDYVVKHTTRTVRARIAGLITGSMSTFWHRDKTATALKPQRTGLLSTQVPLLLDEYTGKRQHRLAGSGARKRTKTRQPSCQR